jgi:hypothetical protein
MYICNVFINVRGEISSLQHIGFPIYTLYHGLMMAVLWDETSCLVKTYVIWLVGSDWRTKVNIYFWSIRQPRCSTLNIKESGGIHGRLVHKGCMATTLPESLRKIELNIRMKVFIRRYVHSLKQHKWNYFKFRYSRWTVSAALYSDLAHWV